LNYYKPLGMFVAIVGTGFLVLSVIMHLYPSIELSKGMFKFNPNLVTPYFILGLFLEVSAIGLFWFSYLKIEKPKKISRILYEKCFSCDKELSPSVDQAEVTKNTSDGQQEKIKLCKDCIAKKLDKQDGVCPECKKPLKWNGNLREFFGEWYHPKCVYELQKGSNTKEIKETREVIVKFRCPYCKYTYDESLDKCPQCGGKRT
jgi:hypothetical protein